MDCASCGKKIEAGTLFCTGCGAAVPPVPDSAAGRDGASSARGWHVSRRGSVTGPFEHARIVEMLHRGEIDAGTYVIREGMRDWRRIGDTAEFAPAETGGETTGPATPSTHPTPSKSILNTPIDGPFIKAWDFQKKYKLLRVLEAVVLAALVIYGASSKMEDYSNKKARRAAYLALEKGDFNAAIDMADEAARYWPFSWKTHYYRGYTYLQRVDRVYRKNETDKGRIRRGINTALRSLKRADRMNNNNPSNKYMIGRCYQILGEEEIDYDYEKMTPEAKELLEKAVAYYDESERLSPTRENVFYWRGYIRYEYFKEYEKAIEDFDKYGKKTREYTCLYRERGKAYSDLARKTKDPSARIELSSRAIDDFRMGAKKEMANNEKGMKDAAYFHYLSALELEYRAGQYKELGNSIRSEEDIAKAIVAARAAAAADPGDADYTRLRDRLISAQLH